MIIADVEFKVLKAYLVYGWSHRKIQEEILNEPAPLRGGGFKTMKILHKYNIKAKDKSSLSEQIFNQQFKIDEESNISPTLSEIQKILTIEMLEVVAKGGYRIEYGELSKNIKKKYNIEINAHLGIKDKIGDISKICCKKLNLPMLSAVVVNNQKKDQYFQKPGKGFFVLYDEINNTKIAGNPVLEEKILKQVRHDIQNCNEWYKLADYLDIKVEGIVNDKVKNVNDENVNTSAEKDLIFLESVFPDEINNNYYEGAVKSIVVNKYERNTKAKKECIKYHGTACKICGFKFSDIYGEQFENKIHVHHLKPISEIGEEYQIDPINDLIPVCPNCHMILHAKGNNDVYSVEEVKNMIKNKKS